MLERIEKRINLPALQEEFRKMGGNFVTAGIVGVFVNHYVGSDFSTMFFAASWIASIGLVFLTIGLMKKRGNKL